MKKSIFMKLSLAAALLLLPRRSSKAAASDPTSKLEETLNKQHNTINNTTRLPPKSQP